MSLFNNTTTITVQTMYSGRPIQATMLLIITIYSIPCFIFVFYHLFSSRTLYRALNNHSIILLLVCNGIQTVTDVPMRIAYYYTSIMWPPTLGYCFIYYFVDFNLFTTTFLVLTWTSFERHILIFNPEVYNIRLKRFIFHFIPLGFCCIYPIIYYIGFIFFYPCESYYDISGGYCVAACFLWISPIMALYEQIAHGFALIFLIFIFNVSLIVRVLRHKRKMKQQNIWTKNRKLALQLISVSLLVFLTNGGYFTIQLIRMLSSNQSFGKSVTAWIFPLSLWLPPLMSVVCLVSLPDLARKLKRLSQWNVRVSVMPTGVPLQ